MTDLNGTPTDNQAAPEELSQAETSQPEAQPDQVSENTQIDAVVEEPSVTTPYPSLTEPFTSKTVSQEYDINKSDSLGKALEPGKEYIPQPSLPMADTIKIFDQVPEASEQDTDSARRYFEAVNVGTEFVPPADRYVGTTERVNSLFRQ